MEKYESPEMELIYFDTVDVITASDESGTELIEDGDED